MWSPPLFLGFPQLGFVYFFRFKSNPLEYPWSILTRVWIRAVIPYSQVRNAHHCYLGFVYSLGLRVTHNEVRDRFLNWWVVPGFRVAIIMSEIFDGYERQYCELSANLSRKCTSVPALHGGKKRLPSLENQGFLWVCVRRIDVFVLVSDCRGEETQAYGAQDWARWSRFTGMLFFTTIFEIMPLMPLMCIQLSLNIQ